MEHKQKIIVGGVATVATAGLLVAVVHWWPSKKGGALGRGRRGAHLPPSSDGVETTPPAAPSPSLHDVSPSTAQFTPGALRLLPVARVSRWHAFRPGSEVATRLRAGHFVQMWTVGPDGVTLTATHEPVRATPELLARAHGDLLGAHAIHAHHHHDRHMGAAPGTGDAAEACRICRAAGGHSATSSSSSSGKPAVRPGTTPHPAAHPAAHPADGLAGALATGAKGAESLAGGLASAFGAGAPAGGGGGGGAGDIAGMVSQAGQALAGALG